jgi:site-specific recombinase XerC
LRASVSKSTHDDYAHLARRHLIPDRGVGKKKLKDLTAEDLDDLYARKTAEGLSPRTVNYIHSVVRVALQRAVKKRLIPYNVARDADPPSMSEHEAKEKTVLSVAQLSNFFAPRRIPQPVRGVFRRWPLWPARGRRRSSRSSGPI